MENNDLAVLPLSVQLRMIVSQAKRIAASE
jgi:hypothetical protein